MGAGEIPAVTQAAAHLPVGADQGNPTGVLEALWGNPVECGATDGRWGEESFLEGIIDRLIEKN